MKRYVIADRDGTLIVEKDYLHKPNEVEIIPGAAEAIRWLNDHGWEVICLSNQSGVGRRYFGPAAVEAVNAKIEDLLNANGARVLDYFFCPAHPDEESTHRKPAPGMALDAAKKHGIDLETTIVVGDKPCDIDLGKNIGATTVLVRTGYGAKHEAAGDSEPDFVINSFADLPAIIEGLGRANA